MRHLGIAGPHRVGKTTLAKALSKELNIPYLEISTSKVFKELGFDVKAQYDIKTRIHIQNAIVDNLYNTIKGSEGRCITDRTPLDCLVYMQADIVRDFPKNLEKEWEQYYHKCLNLQEILFAQTYLVQPGIPIIDDEKSAPPSPAYINHLNTLFLGMTKSARTTLIPKAYLNLNSRITFCTTHISELLK